MLSLAKQYFLVTLLCSMVVSTTYTALHEDHHTQAKYRISKLHAVGLVGATYSTYIPRLTLDVVTMLMAVDGLLQPR